MPYLRIPLLLSFFSAQHRVSLLAERTIQEMLDAALFHPGEWQPDTPRRPPSEIPTTSRDVFATPAGLLLNELHFSPDGLLAHLLETARNALDLDMGRYKPKANSRQDLALQRPDSWPKTLRRSTPNPRSPPTPLYLPQKDSEW